MVEVIPLSQRRIDIVLVAFFVINLLFVSYLIDIEQLVVANPAHFTYPIWPPRVVVDFVHWIIIPLIILFRMGLSDHPFTRPAAAVQTSMTGATGVGR